MKKLILMAAAAISIFGSCSNDSDAIEPANKVLSVSLINPPRTAGRAIEAPTPESGLSVENGDGIIFITDQTGVVKRAIAFEATFPGTQTTQTIANVVSTDRVFVLANIGSANVTSWTSTSVPATVDAIKALTMDVTSTNVQTYAKATLSNASGTGTVLQVAGNNATAAVAISPTFSRLELKNVVGAPGTGSGSITSFDVIGVYVDDYYTAATMGGLFDGSLFEIGQQTSFVSIGQMQDEGTWSSAVATATPGASTAWVYSVPSGNVPRFVVKLNNVVGTFENGNAIPNDQTYFLTVKSYSGFSDTNFVRGKVYHVDNLTFVPSNLQLTPNPLNVDLEVTLTVTQWTISNIGTILM